LEWRLAERRKAKKKNPKMGAEAGDSEDEEEEDPVLIAWEVEWWAKEEWRLFIKYVPSIKLHDFYRASAS